jgi:uncharacterized membrane protein
MDNVIVITFNEASKAYQGLAMLRLLDEDGRIDLRGAAVVERQADGQIMIPEGEDRELGLGTLFGAAIGTLVGLFGGPVGLVVGMAAGAVAGATGDGLAVLKSDRALRETSRTLPPGATALIAQAHEYATEVIDGEMARLGGPVTIVRRPLAEVEEAVRVDEKAAGAADRAAVKADVVAHHERVQATISGKIDEVKARLHHGA